MSRSFSGSSIRHGTQSGWTEHARRDEDPCAPCFAAKQEYDRKRREDPDRLLQARLHAKAQYLASKRLRHAHKEEYDNYYQDAKAQLYKDLMLHNEYDARSSSSE